MGADPATSCHLLPKQPPRAPKPALALTPENALCHSKSRDPLLYPLSYGGARTPLCPVRRGDYAADVAAEGCCAGVRLRGEDDRVVRDVGAGGRRESGCWSLERLVAVRRGGCAVGATRRRHIRLGEDRIRQPVRAERGRHVVADHPALRCIREQAHRHRPAELLSSTPRRAAVRRRDVADVEGAGRLRAADVRVVVADCDVDVGARRVPVDGDTRDEVVDRARDRVDRDALHRRPGRAVRTRRLSAEASSPSCTRTGVASRTSGRRRAACTVHHCGRSAAPVRRLTG
jgi:hypothetical protein